MNLHAGDWLTIRTKDEILATLDTQGCCNGLPFMPQMFEYCGQRFRVYKRAHKTCDTVNKTGGRRIEDCVHLDLRCDGEVYGGCQAACLLFWHTSWIDHDSDDPMPTATNVGLVESKTNGEDEACTEGDVSRATRVENTDESVKVVYRCQATQLPAFTTELRWWDFRQYWEDYRSGNNSVGFLARGILYFVFTAVVRHSFWRARILLMGLYDRFQAARGGVPFPRRQGALAVGKLTPRSSLELNAGDLGRVKSHDQILATLNTANKNRGLFFDAELVPYCGQTFRIRSLVHKFLDEKTGKMIVLKRPSYILEGVWCRSKYSECRLACPRSIYSWWREIWLEKVSDGDGLIALDEEIGQ